MQNINFNPFPLINTNRLMLRQIEKSDVNEIFFLRSDERVMKYIGRPPAKTIDDAYELMQKIADQEKIMMLLPEQLLLRKN